MHRPPDLTLPATPVNAPAPEWMTPITTTSRPRGSGMFGNGTNRQLQQVETSVRTQGITRTVRQEFETKSQALPTNLEAEISSYRSQYPNSSLSAVQAWQREVDIREALRTRKTAELAQRTTIANAFFGSDPRDKSFADFVRKATTIDTLIWPGARSTQLWEQSFLAAHEAQLLRQSIALLQQQSATAYVYLRAAQNQEQAARVAAEQARVAAEQAQQLAVKRSRIAAEQQRQKDIADAALREQEKDRAREEARLAALAKKQRQEAHISKLRADIARDLAEIEARETARIASLKAAVAEAESKADADAQHFAADEARHQAEMEQRIEAIQNELDAEKRSLEIRRKVIDTATAVAKRQTQLAALKIQQQKDLAQAQQQAQLEEQTEAERLEQYIETTEVQHVYPASGVVAASSPVFSFASNAIHLPPAASSAILNALRTATQTVKAAGATLLGGPVLVGFAALLMPSRLGNGDRFTMSVPFSELSSESPQTLREIADRRGTLEMPVGLGVRRLGAGSEVFVASADDFHIRSSVLVLNAAYDLLNDVYETALPDSPTDFLTWTPAISPGNNSTESPLVDIDSPAYSGASIIPLEGRLDLHPVLVEGWERFIIVFPDDSGIEPLYVVFSDPYEGALVKGDHSGRDFNPDQIGGDILDLQWVPATISAEGTSIVKLHISKFLQSDANEIMLERLERITRGELEATDTDKRFYTHEIREFERFKALGFGDTERPDIGSPIWNNVHTATLEDFQLKDDPTLLYTPEALTAAYEQEERNYQKLLKEMWQ